MCSRRVINKNTIYKGVGKIKGLQQKVVTVPHGAGYCGELRGARQGALQRAEAVA